jgi:hypothetical protein
MAKPGRKARVFLDKYEITGELNSVTLTMTVGMEEDTVFQQASSTFSPTLKSFSLEEAGFFRTGFDGVLSGYLGLEEKLHSFAIEGAQAVGEVVYSGEGPILASYEISSPVGALVTASISLQGSGDLERTKALRYSSETASGTGETLDWGASGTSGAAGYLHVVARRTDSTLDVVIQDSPDQTTWTDLITFSSATDTMAERVAVTGSVDQYLRAIWTVTDGASPSGSWKFLVTVVVF